MSEKAFNSRENLELIIDKGPAVLFLWKKAEGWPVVYVSENVKQYGYSPDDFYSGRIDFAGIMHSDDTERVADEIKAYEAEGADEFRQEYRIKTKDGALRWVDDRTFIRRDPSGAATHYHGLIIDITERKKIEERLGKINQCFLSLGIDSLKNIDVIVSALGDVLGGECALYNRLEEEKSLLCTWCIWHEPMDYIRVSKPEGHICYDVIVKQEPGPFVLENLDETNYKDTDPNVKKYGLKSYIGYPVKLNGKVVGSLCLCDTKTRKFTRDDCETLGIFARAVEREEERVENERFIKNTARFAEENPSPVMRVNWNGVLLYANNACGSFMEEWQMQVGGVFPAYVWNLFSHSLPSGAVAKVELEHHGNIYTFTVIPVAEERYINLYAYDISDLRKAEDELKKYRDSLQEMVEERTFNLIRAISNLQNEVAERRRIEARLQETLKFKSDFLANMSHELRTPLNSIMGYTDLVLKDSKVVLPEKRRKNLVNILTGAETLLSLVQNVLDMSRIEKGKMEISIEEFSLVNLIDSCTYSVEGMVGNKPLKIVKDIDKNISKISSDKDKVSLVIINLLTNAIKFTDEGKIMISVFPDPDKEGCVSISISDTGIGVPKELQETIFEQFKQIDASPTRRHGGVGMGLSIVKSYVELLDGSVSVESEPGKGSVFKVTLPMKLEVADLGFNNGVVK